MHQQPNNQADAQAIVQASLDMIPEISRRWKVGNLKGANSVFAQVG